jgi:hypothetical protein
MFQKQCYTLIKVSFANDPNDHDKLVWKFKLPLLAHGFVTTLNQTLFLLACVWVQRTMRHADGAEQGGVKVLGK